MNYEEITQFKSDDGEIFDNENDAIDHCNFEDLKNQWGNYDLGNYIDFTEASECFTEDDINNCIYLFKELLKVSHLA